MDSPRYTRDYAAGEDIFRQGDAGDEAFIIEQGRVAIWSVGASGEREAVAELGPGEVFGEMALVNRKPRAAGASAREPTRLRAISRAHLQQRLDASDPLLRLVLGTVMARLRATLGDTPSPPSRDRQPDDAQDALRALQQEHAISAGLDDGEFRLHFQPVLRLSDRAPVGYEALARWERDGRLVPPPEFIPVTERSDLAIRFGRWVGATAVAALAALDDAAYVSINVSVRQFGDALVLDQIADALAERGIPTARMRLEVTETHLLTQWDSAIAWLDRARAIGMGIMLDDFGTGYSSLAYLHRLPLTALKIDRSFVATMLSDPASAKILRTITLLARDLDVDCIAEGIESDAQADALVDLGVAYGQGFLFGRPAPLAG
ncbi:EAL domain-containing protein [Algiphilus sp.]|uniref:EAL domain-containing protein n=1 Tax=Algiphilus sp. TaxID=1872431 RepID=UPI0025C10CA0|nr:EAL domain-containing protein [Algiphilus sp.]MCK5769912.1 EAL domain-containing protein [Algiphilus sp.]